MQREYYYQTKVHSNSNPTKPPYTVSLTLKGEWQCSCTGWINHYPRIHCIHIKKVIRENPGLSGMILLDVIPSTTGESSAPKTEEVVKMKIDVEGMKKVVEEYVTAFAGMGCRKVSDAWKIGNKKYVYFPTKNGFALQYDGKRVGTATTVAELKAFIETAPAVSAPTTTTPTPTTPEVKNTLLTSTKPIEGFTDKQINMAYAVGIQNPEVATKDVLSDAIAYCRPVYRGRHKWVEEWIAKHGLNVEKISQTEYRRRAQHYFGGAKSAPSA